MINRTRSSVVVILLACGVVGACNDGPPLGPSPQASQRTIEVSVRDAASGRPVPYANLWVLDGPNPFFQHRTDEEGLYRITSLVPGTITLRVEHPGYQELQQVLELNRDQSLHLSMQPRTFATASRAIGMAASLWEAWDSLGCGPEPCWYLTFMPLEDGPLTIELFGAFPMSLSLGQRVIAQSVVEPSRDSYRLTADARARTVYTLRLSYWPESANRFALNLQGPLMVALGP